MFSLLQVLSLILAIATTSLASPGLLIRGSPTAIMDEARGLTNAERFQRGLPPLAPRALYNPTRVRRDSLPSSSPTIVAKIAVSYKDTGAAVGYMRGASVNTESFATIFSFRNPSSVSDLVELNDYSSGQHYVFAAYTDGYYVGPSSDDSLILTTSPLSTPAGSPQEPDYTKGPTQYSESTVWSIDPSTGVVEAYWVNQDGSRDQVYFLASTTQIGVSTSTSLAFTGDVAAYKAQYSSSSRTYNEVVRIAICCIAVKDRKLTAHLLQTLTVTFS
ncbi:hypothetical protein GGU10DRAFT_378483 [Lentinula aff. detonsa]|uniref:Uncharacterized protein n=1 Tax=Lentinula aff. detonsa TaxID=2804958 RepID=A0AA38KXU6_9AGAR|nr:hypothetical protein GGU10DRAFT_378483 [Lentinula aff. detonsa]